MARLDGSARLGILISANANQLNSEFGKVQKQMNSFKALGKSLAGVTAGIFAVGQIKAFGAASIKAFDIQQQAQARLLVALKKNEGAQKRLIKEAARLQTLTVFGDEAIISGQALLAGLTLNEAAITRITPLVLDLATAYGMDLNSAFALVGKSIGSSTNALSRYGIEIKGAVGSGERLESAINALSAAFEGQAFASVQVGAGKIEQMKNALGDLQEEIGRLLSAGVTPLSQKLLFLIRMFKEGSNEAKTFAQSLFQGGGLNVITGKIDTPNKIFTSQSGADSPSAAPTFDPFFGFKQIKKQTEELKKAFGDLDFATNLQGTNAHMVEFERLINSVNETLPQIDGGFNGISSTTKTLVDNLEMQTQELAKIPSIVDTSFESMAAFAKVSMFAGGVIEGLVSGSIKGFKALILVLLDAVQQQINLAIAAMITKEVSSKGLPGLAFAAIGVGLLKGLIQRSLNNAPSVSSGGGISRGGGLAPVNSFAGGVVQFQIQGNTLVGFLEQQGSVSGRIRGE